MFVSTTSFEKSGDQTERTQSSDSSVGEFDDESTLEFRKTFGYSQEMEDRLQAIRDKDFARLDEQQCVYLDYTGAMLAPDSLVDEHGKTLRASVLGNPHSENAPSLSATDMDIIARETVLSFCQASPDDYTVIWTANASGALRVVGECYPFQRGGAFLYALDCHNSVLGIGEFARKKKAKISGFNFLPDSLSYDWSSFTKQVDKLSKGKAPKLLGFPAESNVSGYAHDVRRYVDYAHGKGWDVFVDTAAFAPANPIDMKALGNPDFLSVSFYKIFGYPTGIGCLVAKRSALSKLDKPWFAGGTVRFVGATTNTLIPLKYGADRHELYEDGTVNFTSFSAVTAGIRYMERIGMGNVNRHVQFFSALMESKLRALKWDNGAPLVRIPSIGDDKSDERGHALAVVFATRSGKLVPHTMMEEIFSSEGISIRTGCFCNPGSSIQLLDKEGIAGRSEGLVKLIDTYLPLLQKVGRMEKFIEKTSYYGYIRISFGFPTNRNDIQAVVDCLKKNALAHPHGFEDKVTTVRESFLIPYSKC